MNKNTFKSIGDILAGIISGAVLSIGTDMVLEKFGVFPPIGQGLFVPWMHLLAGFPALIELKAEVKSVAHLRS